MAVLDQLTDSDSNQSDEDRIESDDKGIQCPIRLQAECRRLTECRIDWSGKKLSSVPDAADISDAGSVDVVNLSFNCLNSLPAHFAVTFTSLTQLLIDGNFLQHLPETLCQITTLQVLSLDANRITTLPSAIGALCRLQHLSLEKNKLIRLPEEIGCLSCLTKLKLRDNCLTSLPQSFGRLSSLQMLDLTYNQITALVDDFGCLSQLTELLAGYNRLTHLPESFAHLPIIELLDLSFNRLTSLCGNFASSSSLKMLCLDGNSDFTHFPEWISNMPNISKLSCSSTSLSLSPLPESFGFVSCHLEELELGGNEITALPGSLSSMKSLKLLNLGTDWLTSPAEIADRSNRLVSLPEDFGVNFKLMQKLWLSNCSLTSLPLRMGDGLSALTQLDLDGNFLSSLPDSLCNLSQLRVLRLCRNSLSSLPDEVGNLISLTELYLAHNAISGLPLSFQRLTELRVLDLNGNCFATFPGLLHSLPHLREVDVGIPKSASLIVSVGEMSGRWSPELRPGGNETGNEQEFHSDWSNEALSDEDHLTLHRHPKARCVPYRRNPAGNFIPTRGYDDFQKRKKISSTRKHRRQILSTEEVAGQFDD